MAHRRRANQRTRFVATFGCAVPTPPPSREVAMMLFRNTLFFPTFAVLACLPTFAAVEMQLYGNHHSLGIIVDMDGGEDADLSAVATPSYGLPGQTLREGFPLTRVSATRFVGSLFDLQPGTGYAVQVRFSDPGDPIDQHLLEAQGDTRPEPQLPTPQQSWIVSPDGSGSACTAQSPCSFAEALARAVAGEEILLQGGVYYLGEFTPPRSGTITQPITIRSQPGQQAVFDGADPAVFAWTALGNGVYRTTANAADTHLVTANDQRLYPYADYADLAALSWGLPGFFADGTTLYVKLAGNADPNQTAMVVSRFNYAFNFSGTGLALHDLTFRHYGRGSYAKAVYLNGASDCWIRDCTFAINDTAIGIKRDAHRNLIENNEFYDTLYLWPWDAVKAGAQLENGAIAFFSPVTGRGNIIRRNDFHDFFDGFTGCPESDNGPLTNETDIYENTIERAGDDGFSADGVCSNLRIWDNRFHDVLVGISLAPILEGPVYALRNRISGTGGGNSNYTGLPFKFNVSGQPTAGVSYLFHNTSFAQRPDNHGFWIKSPGTWRNIVMRNNLWVGTAHALYNANTAQPIDLDYDLFWNQGDTSLIRWGTTNYDSLATFSAATGNNRHGMAADPLLLDPEGGDFTPSENSPVIDAGLIMPGINDSFSGDGPDLGANERLEPTSGQWMRWRAARNEVHYLAALDRNSDGLINVLDFVVD